MNKKLLAVLGVTTLALGVTTACSKDEGKELKVVMITDVGDIDDRSFNQGTWEGMVDYLKPLGYKENTDYKYIKPASQAHADYMTAIDNAVTWGAKAIICPGFLFEAPVHEAQKKYPDVKFLIEDGVPHAGDFNPDITDNTLSVFFNENESGFYAGYAAVKDGNKNLGFTGGMSVPAVKKFGIGYVAGAYYAANEDKVEISIDDDHYTYLGEFFAKPEYKALADAWYKAGTDVIFSAAGGAGASIMAAAEENDKWMIGVDVDQSNQSKKVLTSAKKELAQAVKVFLDGVFGTFEGGQSISLGTKDDGVGLPQTEEAWRFTNFSKDQYNAIYAKVKSGEVVVPADYDSLVTFVAAQGAELKLSKNAVEDTK